MQNRCTKCGHFVSSSWPFELCKSCRTARDDAVLGVDEHGFTATPGEIQEGNMPERFFYEDDEPLADVLNSPIAGEAMLTEPPDQDLPLVDRPPEVCCDCNGTRQGCGCEDCQRVGGCFVCSPGAIVERTGAPSVQVVSDLQVKFRPVKRRWWHSVRWH